MATCDHPADLSRRIPYPVFPKPRLPIDSRIAAFPEKRKGQRPVSSTPHPAKEEGGLFQDTLLESGGKSRPRNPWAAMASLVFQLIVVAALIIVPLFHTDVLPKRQTLTMLFAPPAAASGVTTYRVPTPTYSSNSLAIPSRLSRAQEAPAPVVGTSGGVVGGVPSGMSGTLPDGALSEVLSNTRSVPVIPKALDPMPKRMHIASRIAEANLIHDVAPTYPPEAGRARIEGTVVLMAVIGKDGTVRDVRVESGLPLLAQAAIDAVKQWRYRPYLLNGEPIEVDSQITINFTLSRG